ncbi:trehalose-6-phosphate synthase [Vallicoccus soli]|uniref:Trehalose-6-phosphate synthase n=1 Tax=Vallicoccus soli TaxID=2339232 RepID=A0A3A3ZNE0_9ACTN|nr:trehalose-6-phosphate synthase [Vallicoccus soli]
MLVASNRGPVTFVRAEDGGLVPRRGGGGLVSGLSAVAGATGALWVCAALGDADREASRSVPGGRLAPHDVDRHLGEPVGAGHAVVRMLDIDALTFHRAYDAVANSTLWFVHHLLWSTAFTPVFGAPFTREWEGYVAYNRTFAEAVAEDAAPGAKVLVQDYHLSLVPGMLRDLRPDLRTAHFSHTPWAPPDYYALLPARVARSLLEGLLGADHAGFLSVRWARAFLDCAERVLGARVDRAALTVEHAGRTTRLGVHPLGVDGAELRERAARPDVEARRAALAEDLRGRRTVVRVDRTELSKNIVRGLLAFRELLRGHPEHVGEVVHVAFAYPSRAELPEYREYTAAVLRVAEEINDEFGTDDWQPVVLQVEDDYARSLAAYRLADVLLVNPVRDGMNLVAKEGPVLAEDGCALVLSTEAGAAEELGGDALLVNPYDVGETADALHRALTMPPEERRSRCRRLAAAATAVPPERWFAAQVDALG